MSETMSVCYNKITLVDYLASRGESWPPMQKTSLYKQNIMLTFFDTFYPAALFVRAKSLSKQISDLADLVLF